MKTLKLIIFQLTLVHSTKSLGAYIDSKLNWSEHLKYIRGKLCKSIGIICILPLYRLQKRVIRLITFSCYIAHTSDLFKDMKIRALSKLYILEVHIFMYKFENNTLTELFSVSDIQKCSIEQYDIRE